MLNVKPSAREEYRPTSTCRSLTPYTIVPLMRYEPGPNVMKTEF